jgi:protein-disulfide isomerase
VTPPTDAEISLTYEMMKRRMGDVPLEQVKEKVVADLMRRKQGELFQTYITALKERKGVKTSLPFPDMPRIQVSVDDDPVRGPETAPVTIIQFAEFQCPYCGKASAAVEQVFKEYDGKVKMVFRDFPLGFHDRAIPAAVAANCAGQQGKYWEMHNQLMSNQRALEDADLEAAARTVEVDINKWQACRKDPAQEAEVRKDLEDGQAAGVSGTPAFFINGIMLSGAQPFSEFKAIIDRELSKG